MEIVKRVAGDVVVLYPKGTITVGDGDEFLLEEVTKVLDEGKNQILIDLVGVPYVDSSGLLALVGCLKVVNKQNGRLKLSNLCRKLRDLFAITKLLTAFDCYESEELAIQAFSLPF
jgi:anti-sigma B factor antagonist